jgi:hypothetical protein
VSALLRVCCAGAPRDLGLDEGEAARIRIRAGLLERPFGALRELLPGSRARRALRDLERFFPHHAERLQGLSLGARVPEAALVPGLAALLAGDAGLAAAVSRERAPRGALVARSLVGPPAGVVLRESRPDNDYRSLELAPAGSPAAWIGVNEHGLAASATALPADGALLEGCAAPAQLLVQDVLQRFDAVDKAVEWALRRPAGGHASLLLADAAGGLAAVEIEGRRRRVLGAGEPLLVGFAAPVRVAALEKALAELPRLDADVLARLLRESEGAQAPLVAVADPVGRRLGIAGVAPDALVWHALDVRSAKP